MSHVFEKWNRRGELMNISIARGEVDYLASNRSIDPRGIRSIPPMNV
jgi:hypothetical protein